MRTEQQTEVNHQNLEGLETKIRNNPARTEILNSLREDMSAMVDSPDGFRDDLVEQVKQADQLVPDFRLGRNNKPILNFRLRTTRGQGYSEVLFDNPRQLDAVNTKAWESVSKGQPESAARFKKDLIQHQLIKLEERIKHWQGVVDDMKANPRKYDPSYGRPNYEQHMERVVKYSELKGALEEELKGMETPE